jgi:hypothetical protein
LDSIAARLERIRERTSAAALAANRDPNQVRLIAVSKGQPSAAIRDAYAAGQRDFGENYAQELARKAEELADLAALRLHMIGHLQRNKARIVARHASCVQSIDSPGLALELDKRVAAAPLPAERRFIDGARLPVLVEVSIAGETQKGGVAPAALEELLRALERSEHLALRGLMCVPPLAPQASETRPYFDALLRLRDQHGGSQRLPELSMGMTADFEQAIFAGATLVRIGSAIFGPRATPAEG